MKPSVFEYDNYRDFLRDLFAFLQEEDPKLSYRALARAAGFSSPNYFQRVIESKRNLSSKTIQRFASALGLKRDESEFFENLVLFNQADHTKDKTHYYEKMRRSAGYKNIRSVEKHEFELYSKWYYLAIRELVCVKDFDENPSWIVKRVRPRITTSQAKDALDLLLKLGFIERNSKGKIVQAEPKISTSKEVRSLAVSNFHRQMLHEAERAIDEVKSADRDISALTLGVNKENLEEIKQDIFEFRQKLLEKAGASTESIEEVYQLTVQFFPLTEPMKKEDD